VNTLFEQSKDLPVVPLAFARWADATEAGPRDEPSSNVVEPVYEVRPEIDEQEMPMNEVDLWQRATKTSGIEVRGDAKLVSGDVVLEAAGGVAELGVRAQLEEVERGFFDLLAKRPA